VERFNVNKALYKIIVIPSLKKWLEENEAESANHKKVDAWVFA